MPPNKDKSILLKLNDISEQIIKCVDIIIQYLEPFFAEDKQELIRESIKDIKKIYENSLLLKKILAHLMKDELTIQTTENNDFESYLSKIRHDLRNSVNIIQGYTEIIIEDFHEKNTLISTVKKFQEIMALSHQILSLIDEIRTNRPLTLPQEVDLVVNQATSLRPEIESAEFHEFKENYNILVVDDIEENCHILKRYLNNLNYKNIQFAFDGEQAVSMIEKNRFNLILLDVDMPNLNGIGVLKKLQEKIIHRRLMVLMISSSDTIENIVEAIKLGAEDFLAKPFNAELLRVRIGSCLEKQWFLSDEIHKTLTTFRKFVPQEFLQSLNREDWLDVNLGGYVESDMTILFADIRSFTTLSETMVTKNTFKFVNRFLHYVCPPIQKHHGFVNLFLGDGIMAIFYNADDAIAAAISMQAALIDYNEERVKESQSPIKIGIGIHSGKVMLGIIGIEDRMQGGVISDTVNVASRIESLTKLYGSALLVSQEVIDNLNSKTYILRFLGKVRVMGKKSTIELYEILQAESEENFNKKLECLPFFKKGLKLYFEKKFLESIEQFIQLLKIYPEDKAAQRYLNNCVKYINNGVPEGWDGVDVMVEK